MEYANGPTSTSQYDIIGRIRIHKLSWNPDRNVTTVNSTINRVFYNYDSEGELPKIVEGKSAFYAEIFTTGAVKHSPVVLSSKILLVKKVIEYNVGKPGNDGVSRLLRLSFEYDVIDTDYRSPSVPILCPAISHIFSDGNWCAVLIEGEASAAEEYANGLKQFLHGGKPYYKHKLAVLQFTLREKGRTATLGYIMCASTSPMLDSDEYDEFEQALKIFITKTYGVNTL